MVKAKDYIKIQFISLFNIIYMYSINDCAAET